MHAEEEAQRFQEPEETVGLHTLPVRRDDPPETLQEAFEELEALQQRILCQNIERSLG